MISFSASFNEIPTGILITDISSLSGTTFPGRCSTEIVFFCRAQLPVRRRFPTPHISRPVISAQRLHCLKGKAFYFLFIFLCIFDDEKIRKDGNIVFPLAQWRQMDGNNI